MERKEIIHHGKPFGPALCGTHRARINTHDPKATTCKRCLALLEKNPAPGSRVAEAQGARTGRASGPSPDQWTDEEQVRFRAQGQAPRDPRHLTKMVSIGMGYTVGADSFKPGGDAYKEMADEILGKKKPLPIRYRTQWRLFRPPLIVVEVYAPVYPLSPSRAMRVWRDATPEDLVDFPAEAS